MKPTFTQIVVGVVLVLLAGALVTDVTAVALGAPAIACAAVALAAVVFARDAFGAWLAHRADSVRGANEDKLAKVRTDLDKLQLEVRNQPRR